MELCEYCKNNFTSKAVLTKHQKTAKYCIKIQNENKDTDIERIFLYDCSFCDKKFKSVELKEKHLKTSHLNRVKAEQIKQKPKNISIEEYDKLKLEIIILSERLAFEKKEHERTRAELETYKKEILNMAKEPKNVNTTTNNNTYKNKYKKIIQNLQPITNEDYKQLPLKLQEEHVFGGHLGYSNLIKENFENKIVCTDLSRKVIKYKKDDKIVTDTNAVNLLKDTFSAVNTKRMEVIENGYNRVNMTMEERLYHPITKESSDIVNFLRSGKESPFINKLSSTISNEFYVDNLNKNLQENN